jgi:glutamate N-acetyltransferase/amino-acid N-acetyltransferase
VFEVIPAAAPLTIAGIELGAAAAGIKYSDRDDLALISINAGANVAAVFTRNLFCAAPVLIAREHLSAAAPRYLLVNSGNANAGTGRPGLEDARRICLALAEHSGRDPREVLPFSTGVIGERLPVDKIISAVPKAASSLSPSGWERATRAIMTTDTVPKWCSATVAVDGTSYSFTGMAKGAGMIRPDMATMLSFVATDAAIGREELDAMISEVTRPTFNRITVDGDTSTNDACVFIASGVAGQAALIDCDHPHRAAVVAGFESVCSELAKAIVRDGEGATKFVTVDVYGGRSDEDCSAVAYAIAESPLVKTAMFAGDPNWGRILAAVGRAGTGRLALDQVSININDYCVVTGGERNADYSEASAAALMAAPEITIRVGIGAGEARVRVWTCDLSYDYVRINAEYRS